MALARTFRHQPLGVIGFLLLLLFLAMALLAPAVTPYDPAAIDLGQRLVGPSHAHWFGTDELGRDIFSRILAGARLSLLVAVSVVGLSLSVGLILGGLAGFYGGGVDTLLNVFVMNGFLSFPGILLAIAFVAFLGPGLLNLVFALAIGGWVGYARLVRAPGAGRQGAGICRGGARARRFGSPGVYSSYPAQYFAAHHCAVSDRHGRCSAR